MVESKAAMAATVEERERELGIKLFFLNKIYGDLVIGGM